ncbi:glycosyltransferase [Mucilaginibacter sp. Bleaf8]|uniref:glycosyltransferase n=1 Tax=Mucilaginibacter sp. Bleaf8 TaxID=2834430 RepID=UPI001BCD30A2|nr:glycosyltransferase [Mucilaginibacter sp. Bleaf8]MBS7563839.1 glycosyltransferase [Mucilaginibacter sp. Bleaf8]
MPKVLRILNRLNIGGPTYNVAYLSRYMNAAYQTQLLAGIKEPHEGSSEYMLKDLGVTFQYVPDMFRRINPINDARAYRHISKEIGNYQPDIVHTHAAKAGVLGRLAAYHAANRPKAIVHTYHGNVFDGYFSPFKTKVFLAIERYLCGLSNAIVAISEKQKDDLVNKYGIASASKVHVIRLGFDLEKFAELDEQKRLTFRNYYRITDDEAVITITGRLTAIKNHALLIKAVKIFRDENPLVKFKVFIVGDGELLDEIADMARNMGFSYCMPNEQNYDAQIIFTSWRKDIDVINAGSDIIALTSLNEGTPVSIIEALASGKGVLCTDVGGVKDVVKDGVTGMLSDLSAEMYAQQLQKLILNPERLQQMADAGKQFALQNYAYQRLVKETEELYKYLLS